MKKKLFYLPIIKNYYILVQNAFIMSILLEGMLENLLKILKKLKILLLLISFILLNNYKSKFKLKFLKKKFVNTVGLLAAMINAKLVFFLKVLIKGSLKLNFHLNESIIDIFSFFSEF